jgi:hypothetical protein
MMIDFAWAGDKYRIRSVGIIAKGVYALIGLPLIDFANFGARVSNVIRT